MDFYRTKFAFTAIILAILLTGCTMSGAGTSAFPGQTSGPKEGSLMAFGDGSVLVFIPDPNGTDSNGQKGFWITLNSISNYQFSLCVQARKCEPPADPNAAKDFADPSKEDFPVRIIGPEIVGPDHSAGYCAWLNGRDPTEVEMKAFGDGSVHGFGPEYGNTGGEAGIQDDTVHCAFDHPLPIPQFLRFSPYYDPSKPMENMTPEILKTQQFCQTDQGFQTFDLKIDPDASVVSFNGDGKTQCQMLDGNRLVCFGDPGTNPQVKVGITCNGFTGGVCPAGSDFNGDGCSNNMHGNRIAGMDDWEMNSNGVLVPVNGIQLPSGGLVGALLHKMINIHGVMVAQEMLIPVSTTDNSSTQNPSSPCPVGYVKDPVCMDAAQGDVVSEAQCQCVSNGSVDFSGSGETTTTCPAGYYFDTGLSACASLGAPQTECLSGFHFNSESFSCESDQQDGNYPGCPNGQLLNPLTGLCDSNSQMLSSSKVLMTVPLQLTLPDCSSVKPGDQGGSSGPVKYCNPITSVCP